MFLVLFKLHALVKFYLLSKIYGNSTKVFHQVNSNLQIVDESGKSRSVSPEIPKIEEPGMYIMVNSIVEFLDTIF